MVVCPGERRGYRISVFVFWWPVGCIEAGGKWRTEQTGGRDDPLPAVRVLPANTSLTAATTNHHNTTGTISREQRQPPTYRLPLRQWGRFLEFPIYRKWKDMDVMLWNGVLGSGKSQSQYGELNGETQIQNTERRVTDKSSLVSSPPPLPPAPPPLKPEHGIKLFSRAEVVELISKFYSTFQGGRTLKCQTSQSELEICSLHPLKGTAWRKCHEMMQTRLSPFFPPSVLERLDITV